jgi:hypothetical protein
MTDHFAGSNAPASSALAELHRQCQQDYRSVGGRLARATFGNRYPSTPTRDPEPSDLDVAISVAQQLLDSNQIHAVREALRLLLRALGAEPQTKQAPAPHPGCPAAHPDDPTPCTGPAVVTVLDAHNAGADGCEHHGARLLASLDGGRVYGLPHAEPGTAICVFKAAATTRPFAWVDGPRTHPSQLSHEEDRRAGEGR